MRHLYDSGCKYPKSIEDDALAEVNWVNSVLPAVAELEACKENDCLAIQLFVGLVF